MKRRSSRGKREIPSRYFFFSVVSNHCWADDEWAMRRKAIDCYALIYPFINSSNYLIQREKIKGYQASAGWRYRNVLLCGSQRMRVRWERLLSGMSCMTASWEPEIISSTPVSPFSMPCGLPWHAGSRTGWECRSCRMTRNRHSS